jgi:RimJ/RimL family protein N-acetyltransferase
VETAFRKGGRIAFRPLEVEDLEACRAWLNDPENHQTLQRFRPLGRVEEREWLEGLHKREEDHVFGVTLAADGKLIGTCGLHRAALPHRSAELGVMIGDRAEQGKGYGREAVRLVLAYGFETLGLHRVELRVYENNGRGVRCYEACGFRREGVKREARWWAGRWWDILEYAILEGEWRARNR